MLRHAWTVLRNVICFGGSKCSVNMGSENWVPQFQRFGAIFFMKCPSLGGDFHSERDWLLARSVLEENHRSAHFEDILTIAILEYGQFETSSLKWEYMVGLKVRMTFWWPYVDFKKSVRNPGGILTLFIESWRHSNPIYLVLKTKKLQIFDAFSTVLCLPCIWYCKYAEYACKLQKTYTQKTMKNNETHVTTLKNQWKIMKHTLKMMKIHLKNNEQHLENNEKSLNAVPDFLRGFRIK